MKIFVRVFSVFLVLLINSGTAFSQNCDALVIDEAGIFGSKGIGSVTEAAKKVQNLGAEVRIRTFSKGTNLDFVQDEFERGCQSWRATDGGTRNNLISMLLAVDDRQFGFYVGSQWERVLNRSVQNQIENDYILPRFRDGDFAGAFVAGLGQVQVIVNNQVNRSQAPNSAPPIVVQTGPTDLTGLWWVMGVLVFIGVIIGLVIVYNNRKKEEG